MQTITMSLPDFWASALINGDISSLDNDEIMKLNKFSHFMVHNYGSCNAVDCTDEAHFSKYHDATNFDVLACDVLDFTFFTTIN
tara:strand:- start:555 stop:806 length:252 start_codon:yes stop_codon:yes gene_type:complete